MAEHIRTSRRALLLIVGSVILLGTCLLATEVPFPTAIRDQKVGHLPEIGVPSVAQAGQVVCSTFDYWEFKTYRLEGTFEDKSLLASWRVPFGALLVGLKEPKQSDRIVKACTLDGFLHVKGVPNPIRVCFLDINSDGVPEEYASEHDAPPAWRRWKPIKTKRPTLRPVEPGLIATGFQRDLVFSGRDGNVLRFSYREFTEEGFARPAFTQELSFTMEPKRPTAIRFRGEELRSSRRSTTACPSSLTRTSCPWAASPPAPSVRAACRGTRGLGVGSNPGREFSGKIGLAWTATWKFQDGLGEGSNRPPNPTSKLMWLSSA